MSRLRPRLLIKSALLRIDIKAPDFWRVSYKDFGRGHSMIPHREYHIQPKPHVRIQSPGKQSLPTSTGPSGSIRVHQGFLGFRVPVFFGTVDSMERFGSG